MTKTVLIVDDQQFVRVMMGKALTGTDGYQVLEARDGMEAIQLMRDQASKIKAQGGVDLMDQRPAEAKIDCIVTDINMLPMNGLEFLKAIRVGLAPVARNMPVIMLTGHAEKQFLATAIALDACGFLVKPVSANVFRERIERAIATPITLKPVNDYATLVVPDIEAKDLWASAAALNQPAAPVRAGDLVGAGKHRPKTVPPLEMKVGDRLAEDLMTDDGVLVVPNGTKIAPALMAAVKDLSEIVKLRPRVAVFRD